jgi:transposase-like protein
MGSVIKERREVNGAQQLEQIIAEQVVGLQEAIATRLMVFLAEAVTYLLGRTAHARRATVPSWLEQSGVCARCGTQQSQHFRRNGHRRRTLLTEWGVLNLWRPRLICLCGGSVRLDFGGLLTPYQRISSTVDKQIQRWGGLALSLRQMQAELRHSYIGPLGLATLLGRLHQLQRTPPLEEVPLRVPPLVQVDAIWITQLRPNGTVRRDAKGRQRAVKARHKRPLLLALGLWPESGHCELLAWQLAEREDEASWLAFLSQLEAAGVRGEEGLKLLIHDGGAGLCAALQIVHFDAATQRCLFHKLRNIADAIRLPEGLTPAARRRQRRAILKEFRAIWDAKRPTTVLRRYRAIVRQYRHTQPAAVATLRRDFRATLAFLALEDQQPTWPRTFLRTTSHLERLNRRLRRRTRAASAYHSDAGILAMVSQEAAAIRVRAA